MRTLIIGLLLSGSATASDQYSQDYLKQLQTQRQNAVAASCRASLPTNPVKKTFYNADGILLEARDYCMYLAIEYVRRQLQAPTPAILTAENTTATETE